MTVEHIIILAYPIIGIFAYILSILFMKEIRKPLHVCIYGDSIVKELIKYHIIVFFVTVLYWPVGVIIALFTMPSPSEIKEKLFKKDYERIR